MKYTAAVKTVKYGSISVSTASAEQCMTSIASALGRLAAVANGEPAGKWASQCEDFFARQLEAIDPHEVNTESAAEEALTRVMVNDVLLSECDGGTLTINKFCIGD